MTAPSALAGVPPRHEVDRALDSYERYVQRDPDTGGDATLAARLAGPATRPVTPVTSAATAEAVP